MKTGIINHKFDQISFQLPSSLFILPIPHSPIRLSVFPFLEFFIEIFYLNCGVPDFENIIACTSWISLWTISNFVTSLSAVYISMLFMLWGFVLDVINIILTEIVYHNCHSILKCCVVVTIVVNALVVNLHLIEIRPSCLTQSQNVHLAALHLFEHVVYFFSHLQRLSISWTDLNTILNIFIIFISSIQNCPSQRFAWATWNSRPVCLETSNFCLIKITALVF